MFYARAFARVAATTRLLSQVGVFFPTALGGGGGSRMSVRGCIHLHGRGCSTFLRIGALTPAEAAASGLRTQACLFLRGRGAS
jgi:hypothetical protein